MRTYLSMLLMSVLLFHFCRSQGNFVPVGGIDFVKGMHLHQVFDEARKEGKFVFIDCFATWCGPCKKMDKEVYTNKEIAEYVNRNFLSVKIQCDTTKNDDEFTKALYSEAHELASKYRVSSLPTFLFFSWRIMASRIQARSV